MKIIGITGPSGAGKSLLSLYLEKRGIPTIDADRVYHSLLIPPSDCLEALRAAFGEDIFLSDGSLDRETLGKIVFGDNAKLALLNSTVLSFVLDKMRLMIADLSAKEYEAVAIDAPTLIESGFDRECDVVISVLASSEARLARITERDSITKEKALLRIRAQKDDDFYISHSHSILYNNSSAADFEESAARLIDDLELIGGADRD